MADSVKAQKLAAARKKLKEYQQKSQKPRNTETKNEEIAHNVDALSSSTHSSINGSFDIVSLESVPPESIQTSPFQNYFDTSTGNVCSNQINFFDSISQANDNFSSGNFFKDDTPIVEDAFLVHSHSPANSIENKCNEDLQNDHQFVTIEDAKKFSQYVHDFHKDGENLKTPIINSNIESLRQLSSQITELIKDEPVTDTHQTSDLERRNLELANLLEQERLNSHSTQIQLREYQNRIEQLQLESQEVRTDFERRLNREVGPLQEQLQCHVQTVGILIGEKTELSTALSQSQLLAKQKVSECEELQGRLKTSRSRVADLERDLQLLKTTKLKYEQSHTFEEEIEKLNKDNQANLLETREKFDIKSKENLELQRQVHEVTHHLSLAQLKIEQITSGENLQVETQIENLTQHKISLEKQVLELSEALKTTGVERDQASAQYQHYVQQLNNQVASLANKLESVTSENETLIKREQNLVHHIGELEKHLQMLQEEHVNVTTNKSTSNETKKNLDIAMESLQNLQIDKDKLQEGFDIAISERNDLMKELEGKKDLIESLKSEMENIRADKPDNAKLLAAMESDKVAAARAVEQNSQLKQQLEEMQQAFVKMSNDKLDLTDHLTSEEFRNKELSEKLSHVEHQLHTLSDAIAIKDNELTHTRNKLEQQNKQQLQHDQLNDRLRHYEAQDGSAHTLQHELQKAFEQVEQLTKENSTLKEELSKMNSSIQDQLSRERLQLLTNENVDNASLNIEVGSQTVSEVDDIKSVDLSMLDKEVAMRHLEEKFTRTMADIANLTEEKQRLEHIVTQLQDETETIGEYIALYQHQRGILQQRTQEKDNQLKRLAYDRENVKKKLDTLNELVKKLVIEKGVLTPEFLEQHKKLNFDTDLCTEHAKMQKQMNTLVEQNSNRNLNHENNNVNTETAKEIIALLTDIKTSNLIQPKDCLENFHPCAWCSGQLLTV
ncbi:hypothetical protein RN001_008689 [Aquatica leii]|uniref:Golgin subfamily A conserved domain-containing protein n=1 Tax=Aquatica leii TaxID=1421715 RepID=A0AAN7SPC2_9COLE|nr:hypothetical protein RN001_008689 [Aquatica leii]